VSQSTQVSAFNDFQYFFTPMIAGLGRAGYQNLRYPGSPAATFSGTTWLAGGRLGTVGPDQPAYVALQYGRQQGQYGMVIPRFVEKALSGQPLEVHGDGKQTRSFCHVQDTIRAVAGLMDEREISGEIFNIGSAERVSILELAERVLAATGSTSGMEFIPHDQVYGLGIEDVLHREPSIEKINSAIGWKPTFDLDRILADVVEGLRAAP